MPDDVSVVGIDNVFLSTLMYPAMTSVRVPVPEMAQVMVERVMSRLAELKAKGRVHHHEMLGRNKRGEILTVSLTADASVTEGGQITYTATLTNPATSRPTPPPNHWASKWAW